MVCLRLLTGEGGTLRAWLRFSRRQAGAQPLPDLFDRLDAVLETRNEGRTWFLREYAVARRHPGIGAGYRILRFASRFASLLLNNPLHAEAGHPLFERFGKALEAWESGAPPEIVYFKLLYLHARDEGFPVREDWWQTLPASQRAEAERRLRRPLKDQTSNGADNDTDTLIRSLENWLQGTQEIRF